MSEMAFGRRRLRAVPSAGAPDLDDLLVRAGRGERAAFPDIYDALSGTVYGLTRRIVRDPELAEDVTQDAFVEIWRLAPRFDPERGSARSWMLTIAHRRAVDRVRREQAHRDRHERAESSHAPPSHDETSESVVLADEHHDIASGLDQLTDLQRQAITLAFYEGRTHKEIAQLLDIPLGTTKTRIRDGLIRLRDAVTT
ncbi:MAG: ECF RNA polymerase sigma factor SigK [Actinomycetota bacterium]|nr:ECF RNA polymerase sigma factor SigK [Actinomycetota bacterium]